jgi:hypothetical protein
MLEILQKLAAAHSLLATMQLALVEEQETPAQLAKISKMAASLEAMGGTLRRDLMEMAGELKLQDDVDRLLTEMSTEEIEG